MKNIHILPTGKPSRLYYSGNNTDLLLSKELISFKTFERSPQNFYITSDEEIKEGDYCISHLNIIDEGKIHNSQTIFNPKTKEHLILLQSCKKIILTTDTDLIKDGVQAIDDEFLEWFVNNPSCEYCIINYLYEYESHKRIGYKISITKQTIEEAAEIHARQSWGVYFDDNHPDIAITQTQGEISISDFIAGAKWQAEKMYSEEDLREAFRQGMENMDYSEMHGFDSKLTEQEWFKQFKKK